MNILNSRVAIKVISGDNPLTASKVAIRAGIDDATHYIDATTLKTDKDIADAVQKYTVLEELSLNRRKRLLRLLRQREMLSP